MVEAVVSSVVQTLSRLFTEEAEFLYGVKDQALDLQAKLQRFQCVLKDADLEQTKTEAFKHSVEEIRELAYSAEITLRAFLDDVQRRRGRRGNFLDILKRCACILNEVVDIHRIGSDIKEINSKMGEFTRTYGRGSLSEGDRSTGLNSRARIVRELRRTYSHTEENPFVGFEDDLRKVVASLLNEKEGQPTFRAVLISGMGGQGKTTLVRKVYHLPKIRRHFDGYAWASVSQQWNKNDILRWILISLASEEKKDEVRRMLDEELVPSLHDVQKKKKCLVVLDDVWSSDVWEVIKPAFPSGENVESKILLTSRNNGVVCKMDDCFIHELKLLSDEESWQLFKKVFSKSTSTDLKIDGDRKDLGRQMVQHCKGLPLAIVVLGGLLKGKHSLTEWEHVHRNIGLNLKGDKYIKEVLAYSYQDLPYRLKPCFLYLGLYPEDHEIELEQLYQLWIAEGFISQEEIRGQETTMDIAQRYMGELVQRCMVQPQQPKTIMERVEHCQIHDLMREMCLLKIKEENFLEIVYFQPMKYIVTSSSSVETSSSPSIAFGRSQIHRLAIYGADDMEDSSILDKLKERSHRVRSLLLFLGGSSFDQSSKLICSLTRELKFLTTLHLEGKSIHLSKRQFEEVIKKLIHLRCLSCRDCSIQEIPSSIVKLRYLQTLDLRSSSTIYIPNVLWKMEYLKHLYLSNTFKTEGKLRLEGLVNLETLVGFNSDKCDIHDLCKLSNLRQVISLNNVTRLYLTNLELEKDPMPMLEKLHNLRSLRFIGPILMKEMVCTAGGFPCLEYLQLRGLKELEEWKLEKGAMPSLIKLNIGFCNKLRIIPHGLRFVTTLRELYIHGDLGESAIHLRLIDGRVIDEGELRDIPSIRVWGHCKRRLIQ